MITTAPAVGVRALPALPTAWTGAARRRIDDWIGAGMPDPELAHLSPAARRNHYTYVSYGDRDLRGSPQLHRCVRYHLPRIRQILGSDAMLGHDLQIAPRFPGETGGPHLDGMGDEARLADPVVPTAVLAVYLTDVGPDDGALGIWPQLLADVHHYARRSLADPGFDPGQDAYRDLMAQARALPPTPLTGKAGSAFLLHGSLPHCNLPHAGTGVRHALFMRFYRSRHYPQGIKVPNGRRGLTVLADPADWARPGVCNPAP